MSEKIILSWNDVDTQIEKIVSKIYAGKERFTQVVGIRNGGAYPAKRIAALMDLPYSDIRISFYDGDKIGKDISKDSITKSELANLFNWRYEHVLFVDDLIDSGRTTSWLESTLSYNGIFNFAIAALYAKNIKIAKEVLTANEYIGSKKPDGWLDFPWESPCNLQMSMKN